MVEYNYAIFRPSTGMFIGCGGMVDTKNDSSEVNSGHVYDNRGKALSHIRYLYEMSTTPGTFQKLRPGERLRLITVETTYKIV